MIRYRCEMCRTLLETDDHLGGQTEPCPDCRHLNTVPKTRKGPPDAKRNLALLGLKLPGLDSLSPDEAEAVHKFIHAMEILWRVIKSSVNAIGAALAPALVQAAKWVTRHILLVVQWIKKREEERRRQKAAARLAQERQWQAQREAEARALARRDERLAIERRMEAHREAVLCGQAFDAKILVAQFQQDWLAVQKDTGLTPIEMSQGVKAASPAIGVGAGYLSGNPWIGLLAGVAAYLASGSIAEEYARGKFEEWRLKWMRIFSNCTQVQLDMFSQVLAQRHPLVYRSLADQGGSFLPGA